MGTPLFCPQSEFPINHIRDDRLARDSLTRWAYEKLWLQSYNAAQAFEVRKNDDSSTDVKKYGAQWDSPDTITIQAGGRCCCSAQIAYMHQCCHEFAMDKKLRMEKYHSRWLNQKSYDLLLCGNINNHIHTDMPLKANDVPMVDELVVPHSAGIPTRIDNGITSQDVQSSNENDDSSSDDDDNNCNNMEQDGFAFMFANKDYDDDDNDEEEDSAINNCPNSVNPSYHNLKQAASDVVETAKGNKKLRKYAIHFCREFTSLLRTGNHIAIESTLYNSICPAMGSVFSKNTSTYADMNMRFGTENMAPPRLPHVPVDTTSIHPPTVPITTTTGNLSCSPLKACPMQGGPTNSCRKASAVESKKTTKRRKGGGHATTTIPGRMIAAQANPISYTSTKSCSFCKQTKHTVKHCPVLEKYGELVSKADERAEVAREIHNPAFYVTESKPVEENCKSVVNNYFPREGMCVIIHHHYLVQNDALQNARPIMHVKCTVLDNTALPMEEYTDALFTPEAVMMYVSSSSKRVVNQLKVACRR